MTDSFESNDAHDHVTTAAPLAAVSGGEGQLTATMESLATGLLAVEPLDDEMDDESVASDGSRTIGTFFIGELEVALVADSVREVVPYPDLVTRVPLTPPSVHGIFSLRGEVLPVLDATRLLGGEETASHEDRRVAIIDIGQSYVGVVFDRTGEVLRVDDREDFGVTSSGGALNGMIESVIQLDGGARCIQQLSLDLLGRIPGVPYRNDGKAGLQTRVDQATYRKAVSVRVGHYELAFPVESLVEIQEGLKVQPSPEYFPHCRGVLQLRGRSFAVMNFRDALQMEETSEPKKLVFVQMDRSTIALEVDSLIETLEFKDTAPIPVPELPDSIIGAICGEILAMENELDPCRDQSLNKQDSCKI